MKSLLVLFHCASNTGYAIGPLERTFFEMACQLCDTDTSRVHFAYPSMAAGPSVTLPADFQQYAVIDASTADAEHCRSAAQYVRDHEIDTIFGFDQPVVRPIYRYLRRAGVRHFVSYWGAPMSSMNILPIRLIKRLGVILQGGGPDHYIFESKGMAELAVMGRGIPARRVSVVPLGVDSERFKPDSKDAHYVYHALQIPLHRRILFYSGHMESRKGVSIIMGAANRLCACRRTDDWHMLLCGNKGTESEQYENMLGALARGRVTFGGYRADLDVVQRGCYASLIASTGWDSFPRSALELQATGVPLIASDLRGIREVVDDGVSGVVVRSGDVEALVETIERLLDKPDWRDQLGKQARTRIEEGFTLNRQLERLVTVVRRVVSPGNA